MESAIQTAVFNRIAALTVPVYSAGAVPDGAVKRYVVIGADTLIEWDTDGSTGGEATVTIHSWDTTANDRSLLPIKGIMGSIYDALNRAQLTAPGYVFVGSDFEFSETFFEADGLTRHGVSRFRIFLRRI